MIGLALPFDGAEKTDYSTDPANWLTSTLSFYVTDRQLIVAAANTAFGVIRRHCEFERARLRRDPVDFPFRLVPFAAVDGRANSDTGSLINNNEPAKTSVLVKLN